MRNDTDLQRDVTHELKWDPVTRDAEIAVAARDGVVTLGGTVASYAVKYAVKYAAQRAAERVGGVRGVADEIDVALSGASQCADTELAHQAVNALRWGTLVPDEHVTARAENGWLTLEGTGGRDYQRRAALRAVQNLTGVRGVSNRIALTPKVSTFDVSQRIKDALRRHAELEARQIEVEAKDGAVPLRGAVHSWAERREAERAAWGTPGVTRVEDELRVQM